MWLKWSFAISPTGFSRLGHSRLKAEGFRCTKKFSPRVVLAVTIFIEKFFLFSKDSWRVDFISQVLGATGRGSSALLPTK